MVATWADNFEEGDERDIELSYDGNLVGILPVTKAGSEWMIENVQAESWMYLGRVLWVETRMADAILNGAFAAGLVVE